MDSKLLEILVCPLCKSPLFYNKAGQGVICRADRPASPLKDGLPMMLEGEARQLPADEDIPRA